tara:strand:- start:1422 stop:1745 length:324 start_codon:yes stop_codon:yes gene_type:complete
MTMRDKIAAIRYAGTTIGDGVARAIIEALPDMIAPLVWEADVEYYSYSTTQTGQYQVRKAGSGWYVQLDCMCSILVSQNLASREQAKAAANAHNREAFKAMITGEKT